MANHEQVAILKQGPEVWNQWRRENQLASVDLAKADFSEVDLRNANFNEADLTEAIFKGAYLREAVFVRANLTRADLFQANLREAILSGASLYEVNLNGADLIGAHLDGTDITGTRLLGTRFEESIFLETNLVNLDLSEAKRLEDIHHLGPSNISTGTIERSKGKISEVFLRGCGLSDVDIEYSKLANPVLNNQQINEILYKIYDLRATHAIQINPLFISYSHANSAFVDVMENHLNEKGIRFWRDIHNATSGRLEKVVDQAIRQNPTVLLVLSKDSVQSDWVEHEARSARELEKELKRDVLCPVALDDAWKDCAWPARLREQIMEYHILDFSKWKDDVEFGKMFRKLIDGLDLFYKKG